jgi:FKBP-type peptidyl-prolyl cis-trans isomerase
MNMTKIAKVLMGLLVLSVACNNEKETPNGFKYSVIKAGDGVIAKPDEIMVFDFVMKDSKDSVWRDTRDQGFPGFIMVADSSQIATEDGIMQMLRMCSKGDSVSATMPIPKFFKDFVKQPVPPGVDSTRSLTYIFKIHNIMDEDKFRAYQTELLEKRANSMKEKEAKQIDEYLTKNNLTAQTDSSGLRYIVHTSKGGGQHPTTNSCVDVNYVGKVMSSGLVFDQNPKMSFPLGNMIPGWKIGIPLIGVGDSATLIIPSGLAYGAQGIPGLIPSDAVLLFDVKLLKVGTFDPQTRTCK